MYEIFSRKGDCLNFPVVKVHRGRLTLNKCCVERLSGASNVLLLWDREKRRVGIMAGNEQRAYRLRISKSGAGVIASEAFYNQISAGKLGSISCTATWNDKELMLEFDLPPLCEPPSD
ncbi:MAG: hypothetical protein NVS1B6_04400 [Steroidobacteraceae bacterium]